MAKIEKPPRPASWPLQDAQARFSELVRRAHSEGPQHVTVRGNVEVVVVSAEEYRRLKGEPTGQALIDAFHNSPFPEINLEPERFPMPVRDVEL